MAARGLSAGLQRRRASGRSGCLRADRGNFWLFMLSGLLYRIYMAAQGFTVLPPPIAPARIPVARDFMVMAGGLAAAITGPTLVR